MSACTCAKRLAEAQRDSDAASRVSQKRQQGKSSAVCSYQPLNRLQPLNCPLEICALTAQLNEQLRRANYKPI